MLTEVPKMNKLECPKCKSNRINQYRTPVGPIWCEDCGYRVEHKEKENPFIIKK